MKHRIITGITMLLTPLLLITGCDNTPPPPPQVTDCDSLIENLRYAGATVNITRTENNATSFAQQYVDFRYQTIESVQDSGKIIEPEFLESETNHLSSIQKQADKMEITNTAINLNGAKAQILEYNSEEAAESDVAYIIPIEDLDFTIPTDKGNVDIVISPLGIELYAHKTGRIIVEYYSITSSNESVLNLLESLLGPPFYEY